MQIEFPSDGRDRPAKARPRPFSVFTIIADVMILAVHVVILAAIIVWLLASGLHLNWLGRVVIGVPIVAVTLFACFQILRLAQAAERNSQPPEA